MPVEASEFVSAPADSRKNARYAALASVLVLTFVLRGGGQDFSALKGAISSAAVLAFVLETFSRWLRGQLNEAKVVSGYVTLMVMILAVIFVRALLADFYFFRQASDFFAEQFPGGSVIPPILISAAITWLFWVLKAKIVDKNTVGQAELIYSGSITALGTVAVVLLSLISDSWFASIFGGSAG